MLDINQLRHLANLDLATPTSWLAGFSNCINIYQNWLVVLTVLKNMKVNGKDYPIYEMENKTCSKPPTRKSRGWFTIWISLRIGCSKKCFFWQISSYCSMAWLIPVSHIFGDDGARPGFAIPLRLQSQVKTISDFRSFEKAQGRQISVILLSFHETNMKNE